MTRLQWRTCSCGHFVMSHVSNGMENQFTCIRCPCTRFTDSSIRVALHYWAWRHREEFVGAALLTLPWVGLIVVSKFL